MNLTSLLLAATLTGATLLATAPTWAQQRLVPAQSSIAFTARQMGVPLQGHFSHFDAQIAFDPAQLASSKIAFTVNTGSATLGSRETDAELPKAEWFNTARFPQATFQSSSIKALGAGKFEVAGKLNIKGQAHDVVVPVTLVQTGANTLASGTMALKRLAYKIGDGEWADTSLVADDVQVQFKLVLTGVPKL